jgi:uncharacterized protein (TIGR02266 family)
VWTVTAQAQKHDTAQAAAKTRHRARRYERVAVRCGCWLEHEGATVFGTTVDIGRGGLFLRTALPMAPGAHVRVTLRLPGFSDVVADGLVVRRIGPNDGPRPGVGVRFECLSEGDLCLYEFLGSTLRQDDLDTQRVG